MMAERKSWVIGVLEILAILTLIGGAVLAFALEGEEEDKTDAESARTGHPGLRVTAFRRLGARRIRGSTEVGNREPAQWRPRSFR